jgi:electron transfer flavoprotein alpha subunit
MDLAPALAVELGIPLATDCIDISLENEKVTVKRSVYNGKLHAVYSFAPCETIIVTGRLGQFPIEQAGRSGDIQEMNSPPYEEIDYKRFEGYREPEESEVDIARSSILVSIGRGIKSKEKVAMAEELAAALGGVVACSRPVVDSEWLPSDRQVGLSGKTVKPKLYLALGISGAFQHMVGTQGAETIIAINSDPGAPIFAVADYGIIGDIFKIMPALVEEINTLKD